MYAKASQAGKAGAGPGAGPGAETDQEQPKQKGQEDVVDADFEDVSKK
jgi:hypothetical protein